MIGTTLRRLSFRLAAVQLSRNGLFAAGQSVLVTVCVFLSYRLVIGHTGLASLGIWSLLLAGSAVVRLGDVSGVGALARFVAMRIGDGDIELRDTVHTVVLTSVGLNVVLGIILWFLAPYVLPTLVSAKYLSEARDLVPFAIALMILGSLAVAVTSAIDGAQRADQRAIIIAAAAMIFLLTSWLLVPRYGIIGFGFAQLLQQASIFAIGWIVLRRHVFGLGWLPHRWKYPVFAETAGYAVKLNSISVMGVLFEPLARFAFNYAGGPSLVALYELAARLSIQIRGFVIAGATPLIPAFAARPNSKDPVFRNMLERSSQVAAIAAICVCVATLLGAPAMSFIVLDRLSAELLSMNAALTAGWAINILSIPMYFAAQAQGILRWNFVSHAVIGVTVLAGVLLVPTFGPSGLVAAVVTGLLLSTLVALYANATALGALEALRRRQFTLLATSFIIAALCGGAWTIAGGLVSDGGQ